MKEVFGLKQDDKGYNVSGYHFAYIESGQPNAGKVLFCHEYKLYDSVRIKSDYQDNRVKGAEIAGCRAEIIGFIPENKVSNPRAKLLVIRDGKIKEVFDHAYVPLDWIEKNNK